jgi:putative tryptophan/tyrosine transport system substrate-binding protein
MQRREFITLLGGAVAAWPLAAQAQQPAKMARIGYLLTGSLTETRVNIDAFREGLIELGYIEGTSFIIEPRAADGRIERLPSLASELVALKVDVIVAAATPAGRAAQQATSTIPIIVSAMGDPVNDGLVASLARPGGNITGTSFLGPELVPKRLGFLKEILPKVSRVAVLWHPGAFSDRTTAEMLKETTDASASLGMQLQFVEVRSPDELEHAFSTITKARVEALLPLPSPMLFAERRHIVELSAMNGLPGMFNSREFVQLGGLIAYGTSIAALNRRSATYVDKILKGAKPTDLPVEQPTKFELFINLKTAKTLGIDVPLFLQQLADEVID